jgi:membrane-bound lytic murein transglycosylase B
MKTGRHMLMFAFGLTLGAAAFASLYEPAVADAQALSEEDKARLRAEYDQLQEEIAQWQKVLDDTKAKKNTLQGDVTLLNAQIKKAEAEIKQRNSTINTLAAEINEKARHIQTLEERLSDGRASLAKLIREKHEVESTPLAILMLSSASLSEFMSTNDSIDIINRDLQDRFDELRGVKEETEKEKEELNDKKNKEADAKYEVEVKKAEVKKNEQEKQKLLDVTKKDEATYSQVLAERKARAEAIRSALFELRDAQGISFATALQYASEAEAATGVRAAFILGILRQESNLGQNVGTCIITDLDSGATKHVSSGKVFPNGIHPTRDLPILQTLVRELGRDPMQTRVSCPQSVGYGGAMGPSQFIPSTWKTYQGRIASAVGVSLPDPWNAKHAITATALFLKDLGADKRTYSAEREAAGRYYAGAGWATRGLGYAGSVLAHAEKYQSDINFLKDN